MSRVDFEETEQNVLDRDRSNAALDAVFATADSGLLAAIRQHLDLEAGLTQIIGAPEPEMLDPEAPTMNGRGLPPFGRVAY